MFSIVDLHSVGKIIAADRVKKIEYGAKETDRKTQKIRLPWGTKICQNIIKATQK